MERTLEARRSALGQEHPAQGGRMATQASPCYRGAKGMDSRGSGFAERGLNGVLSAVRRRTGRSISYGLDS